MLRFHTEEEAGCKVVHGKDARHPTAFTLTIGQVVGLEVASNPQYEIPDAGKPEPTEEEAESEKQKDVSPSHVQHCVEIIQNESVLLFAFNVVADVDGAFFRHDAPS